MFKKLCKEEESNRKRSETGGEMSAMEKLLSGIIEAVDSMCDTKAQEKKKATRKETRKLDAGRRVLAAAFDSKVESGL